MTDWLVGSGFKLWDDQRQVMKMLRVPLENYCLVKDARLKEPLQKVPGVLRVTEVSKRDLLRDEMLTMLKVDVTTVAVLRNLQEIFPGMVWEADVRASDDFLAATDRTPGMPWDYKFKKELTAEQRVTFKGLDEYLTGHWFQAFEHPAPKYLVGALDIETWSPGSRLSNPFEAEVPVICVSVRGSDGMGCCWVLRRDGSPAPQVDFPLKVCDSEFEMLVEVFAYVKKYPFLVTHNGDEFDLPFLYNRALRLGFSEMEIPIRVGVSKAYFDEGLHLDLLRWFDNQSVQIYVYQSKYKDMDLDSVAKGLLGRGKIPHEEGIGQMDYKSLATYNWNDCGLSLELATYDDQYTMMMMTMMSRLSGLFLEDVCRYKVGSWITNIVMREHRRQGALIPNRDEVVQMKGSQITVQADIKGGKYKGALVQEPVPGVHWNVGLFDFASLYPSIIETWNLGYATLECPHISDEACGRRVPDLGYRVCGKVRAIESNFIEVLRGLRVRYYKPLSKAVKDDPAEKRRVKAIEGCLKVVMNASYGVFGSDKFAFYYPKIAETIAALGRYVITAAKEEAKKLGMPTEYGDTDSLFLGNTTKENAERLVDWAKAAFHMDFEFADTFVWLILTDRKKNYMGLQESDGKVKVMGMTGKKRNTPAFIRGTFDRVKDILKTAKTPEEFEAKKREVAVAIYSAILDLWKNEIPIEAMAFTMALSQDADSYKVKTQHVRVAEAIGQTKGGSIICFVKTKHGRKRKGIPVENAKSVTQVRRDEIDLALYEEMMRSTFSQILDSLRVPWPQKGGRQVKLA